VKKNILAIIPARGGSKGVPFKNIADVNGKPLIAYTIEAAKKSALFDKIVVSTDNKKIKKVSEKLGAKVITRPRRLSTDKISTESVMLHVLGWLQDNEGCKPDIIFLLQPTSPLRNAQDIKQAYRKFIYEKLSSLLSVTKNRTFIWQKRKNKFTPMNYNYRSRPRRQEMNYQFQENGAIYITRYSNFMKLKNRLSGNIGYYVMDEEMSIDVDSPLDLAVVEQILKKRKR
jgi:CMP-N,N'-diacetyllegionaminic acid synthase